MGARCAPRIGRQHRLAPRNLDAKRQNRVQPMSNGARTDRALAGPELRLVYNDTYIPSLASRDSGNNRCAPGREGVG